MMWVAGLVVGLVLFGSILAIAESSFSRMTRFRLARSARKAAATPPSSKKSSATPLRI